MVMTRSTRARKAVEARFENDSLNNIPPSSGTKVNVNGKSSDVEQMAINIPSSDRTSIAILLFLYVLQGIPLGLAGSIPLILAKKVGYKQQAMFSFVYWPYSVKLLWAPIVDAAYISKIGRRKTWLVPVQYLIGIFMLVLSKKIGYLLGETDGSAPDVFMLTAVFFCLNFLTATQDIAVDGWALTMLSRANVGWASTCNTVGQTAGYFLGNVVFLALSSPEFANKYIRSVPLDKGLIDLGGFLFFWGIVFLITTTLIGLLKHERSEDEVHGEQHEKKGILSTYKTLWTIITLPAVMKFIVILLTCKVGFAAADSVTGLKLVEAGIPKENLAMLAIPMVPIQILLPLYISKYTSGPKPFDVFLRAFPCRLLLGLVFILCVWWANNVRQPGEEAFPWYFYAGILCVYAVHQVTVYCMFVAIMAFHARISDPRVGGTYMTLLNTITNLGGNWPPTLALWLVDELTWKNCLGLPNSATMECNSKPLVEACTKAGGKCVTSIDGYYIESIMCIVIGFIWLILKAKECRSIQEMRDTAWKAS
ncbi:acetyl-coenzyme A transporter 1-like [Actinia tenebrosa]|uniref:Acetyl-coenzyme A transporter 1-like n=1 Tax=Actinia tenebrosa TaxID=6105 RepID=A0A6P8J379_ACTTE|nr:acetyl-coenzyme A transporter 1-like [Actinia tenebrosa]